MTKFKLNSQFHPAVKGLYGLTPYSEDSVTVPTKELRIDALLTNGRITHLFGEHRNPIDDGSIAGSSDFVLPHDGAFGQYSEEYGFDSSDQTRFGPVTCIAVWSPAFKDWMFVTNYANSAKEVTCLHLEMGVDVLQCINFAGYMTDPLTNGRVHPGYTTIAYFDPLVGRYVPEGWEYLPARGRYRKIGGK